MNIKGKIEGNNIIIIEQEGLVRMIEKCANGAMRDSWGKSTIDGTITNAMRAYIKGKDFAALAEERFRAFVDNSGTFSAALDRVILSSFDKVVRQKASAIISSGIADGSLKKAIEERVLVLAAEIAKKAKETK